MRIVLFECVEGKNHVVGCNGPSIVPFCVRAQAIGDAGKIGRLRDCICQQPILGRCLVHRARQQRVVDEFQTGGQPAFPPGNHHIEIVVSAECPLARDASFRCAGIDVIKLCKAGMIFKIAEEREPMPPWWRAGARGACRLGNAYGWNNAHRARHAQQPAAD